MPVAVSVLLSVSLVHLISVHSAFGHGEWDDYADDYERGLRNRQNKVCLYDGVFRCVGLVTKRGHVLASTGVTVRELEYLIRGGYIKT